MTACSTENTVPFKLMEAISGVTKIGEDIKQVIDDIIDIAKVVVLLFGIYYVIAFYSGVKEAGKKVGGAKFSLFESKKPKTKVGKVVLFGRKKKKK